MKCKFCDAELEEENLICPGCGAENVPEFVPEEAVMPAAEEAEAPAAEKVPAVSGLSGWKLALVIAVLVFLVTVITDYIVVGTTLTILTVPVYLGITEHSMILALILCIATGVIAFKHRMNYVRIYNGSEIGLRSVMKGKHRIH